jgi:hypothetical protein
MNKLKLLALAAVAISIILFLNSCNKDKSNSNGNKKTYDSYFYTSNTTNEVALTLFVNNELIGDLPYLSSEPSCGNTEQKNHCLFLNLTEGKNTLTAKDKKGKVVSETIFTIKTNSEGTKGSIATSSKKGGSSIFQDDNCIIVNLFD